MKGLEERGNFVYHQGERGDEIPYKDEGKGEGLREGI